MPKPQRKPEEWVFRQCENKDECDIWFGLNINSANKHRQFCSDRCCKRASRLKYQANQRSSLISKFAGQVISICRHCNGPIYFDPDKPLSRFKFHPTGDCYKAMKARGGGKKGPRTPKKGVQKIDCLSAYIKPQPNGRYCQRCERLGHKTKLTGEDRFNCERCRIALTNGVSDQYGCEIYG